jgi:membrane protein DedA with SNARE-associated domain
MEAFVDRFGYLAVAGLRSLISIPAGTARMGIARFTLYTALGSAAWNALLCSLGVVAGSAWHRIPDVPLVSEVAVFMLLAACLITVVRWVAKRALPSSNEICA